MVQRRKERDNKIKEWEDNDRIGNGIQERKKSHNERELEKILEREKQESIKEVLRIEEQRRQAKDRLDARNMMKFNGDMFRQKSILEERNVFLRGGFNG